MKRVFLSILLLFAAFALEAQNNLTDFPSNCNPKDIGAKLGRRFIASPHMMTNSKCIVYPEVCIWLGSLRFAQVAQDTELQKMLEDRFAPLFTTENILLPPKNHVDFNMFGSLPLELYKVTKDKKYLDLGLLYADTQWTAPEGMTPEQKKLMDEGYTWQTRLWIDDMFMITIVQAEAYNRTGDRKYLDRAAKEMVYYLKELQRPNGLFYHAPDVPYYWARGNGWMAVGMTELLKVLPENHPDRKAILDGYHKMMKSLKKYQGKDGMWRQLVDQPDFWPETSGSAMFTYAMIEGVKNGWLKKDYTSTARKGWIGMIPYINEDGDVREVCVGTNKLNDKQYYFDRTRAIGDFHGQAPYVWCATALLEQ